MTNLDSALKRRDITLLKKVCIVKVVVFPVVVYGCKSWTIQKAEHWRTDAFKLSYWRGLFRISWTARRSNEWILNQLIGRTDSEVEAPVLWPPDAKSQLIRKDPDAGKDWGQEEEKGVTEDEMVGWRHGLNRHQLSTLGDGLRRVGRNFAAKQQHVICCGFFKWFLLCRSCFILFLYVAYFYYESVEFCQVPFCITWYDHMFSSPSF